MLTPGGEIKVLGDIISVSSFIETTKTFCLVIGMNYLIANVICSYINSYVFSFIFVILIYDLNQFFEVEILKSSKIGH